MIEEKIFFLGTTLADFKVKLGKFPPKNGLFFFEIFRFSKVFFESKNEKCFFEKITKTKNFEKRKRKIHRYVGKSNGRRAKRNEPRVIRTRDLSHCRQHCYPLGYDANRGREGREAMFDRLSASLWILRCRMQTRLYLMETMRYLTTDWGEGRY